jgi:hypothetical protein
MPLKSPTPEQASPEQYQIPMVAEVEAAPANPAATWDQERIDTEFNGITTLAQNAINLAQTADTYRAATSEAAASPSEEVLQYATDLDALQDAAGNSTGWGGIRDDFLARQQSN